MKIAASAVIGLSILLGVGGADTARAMAASRGSGATMAEVPLPLEPAQYDWGGQPYCWYFEGWRGPGWYRCGNPWRRGYGWGGGHGWRGWDVPGWRGEHHGRRRDWDDRGRRHDWDDRGRGRRDWGDDGHGRRGGWGGGDDGDRRGRGRGRDEDG